MLTITLNKTDYQFPEELKELSYSNFLALMKCKDDLSKLELLMDVELRNLPSTIEKQMERLISLLDAFEKQIKSFLTGRSTEEIVSVKVFDKTLKFDKHLGKLAYWPFTNVKSIVKLMGKEPFNEYEHYTDLVGHYLYSKVAEYDEYKANDFCEEYVANMPFAEVVRLGDFFLYTQRHLWMSKQKSYKAKLTLTKLKLVSMFSTSTKMATS
jgi:hypothetical protein